MPDISKRVVIQIDEGWQFREASETEWLPVAQFPTNVHLDLLRHKKIPDPFLDKNELLVQWVGEKTWLYRTEFDVPDASGYEKVVLNFDGLDTFATVVVNGHEILKSNNMFIPQRVDITKVVKAGDKNSLEITFDSALILGKKIQEQYPDHKWVLWNGDASRLAVRKAQYHYGWDWGPTLMTAGPWRPVWLELYNAKISDLYFTINVADSLDSASVVAKADVEGSATEVIFELSLNGKLVQQSSSKINGGYAQATLDVSQPELWYPTSYGSQPLYELKATLLQGGSELDASSKRVGIRKARVVQRELNDAPGTSFFFEINNIPIFCGGSNWIPADNFIPRIGKQKYYDWLKIVRDGNQAMVRVWGGGIYEEDVFYDAADELGILIWQDFMFACGNYPAKISSLRDSIKEEAIANVKRLRHHPSIVIYAGNNEDYSLRESEGLTYDPENKDPDSWLETDFPARYIYEKILVDVTKELVPDTYYHFGSPYGGEDTSDTTVGDIHQWNVWHGSQERYQNYDKLSGRFVSEFGMEAFPDAKTIESYITEESRDELYAQSQTVDFHNKADGHEKRLAGYLAENFDFSTRPLKDYVYVTQLMQADCLSTAYRVWRRNWKGPGREYTAGALVWQINDCWPVTSWAIADYYLRPKLSYYAIKQHLAPVIIGMKREVRETRRDKYTSLVDRSVVVELWVSSFLLNDIEGKLHVKAFDVITGNKIYDKDHGLVQVTSNRSTDLVEFGLPKVSDVEDPSRVVIAAYLFDLEGKQIARYVNWPEPLKYVKLQHPTDLRVDRVDDSIRIQTDRPLKGVTLEANDVEFEENLADIVPEETVTFKAKESLGDQKVDVRFYKPDRHDK